VIHLKQKRCTSFIPDGERRQHHAIGLDILPELTGADLKDITPR
jgi:hypothetical protein